MTTAAIGQREEPHKKLDKRAALDLGIVLAVFTLGSFAIPVLNPILRHGKTFATLLAAAAFQLLVEGTAPFTLMALRREGFASYGLVRRNIVRSLIVGLFLAVIYDAALSWHAGAVLWVPLRRQPAMRISLSLGFPLNLIGIAISVLIWGFTEGFFGVYFAKKVNLALGRSGAGWFAPGVLAFALFNGLVHLIVGQGMEGFISSFASGYAIAVVPAVTENAWGGTLVQTLTNAAGRL